MTAALAVAIVLSFLDGMLGIVGGIVAASLLLAYGVLGFAVLHAITQGMSARPFVLSITYAGVILLAGRCLPSVCLDCRNGDRIARARIRQTWPPTVLEHETVPTKSSN
jgi:hypothetical protein